MSWRGSAPFVRDVRASKWEVPKIRGILILGSS